MLLVVVYGFASGKLAVLTPDQSAYRLYSQGKASEAAKRFADPMWKGVALFKNGEFDQAARVFAGFDTAEAAFNQGNSLVMQGKYEEAVIRYGRALELRPNWEAAIANREIALGRAELLKQEGGEGTGGMLEADEIVFSEGPSNPSAEKEQVETGGEVDDAELRAVWLRQVQTKPADFLRAKFAYQEALRGDGSD
jgi:Ca-activated chloride channel family protein